MPTWNSAAFLRSTLQSILNQSFSAWELIVVDDGSTDQTCRILDLINDPRIRIIHNPNRKGIAHALNLGLQAATAPYIARMDSDDISRPHRLKKQYAFMEAHPEIGLCGTQVKSFGGTASRVWHYPIEDAAIRARLFFKSSFAHPTVMFNREQLEKHQWRYDESYLSGEDWDLWLRVSLSTKMANLPDVLLDYRQSPGSASQSQRQRQKQAESQLLKRNLDSYGVESDPDTVETFHRIVNDIQQGSEFLEKSRNLLEKLDVHNKAQGRFQKQLFENEIGLRFLNICQVQISKEGWRAWKASPFARHISVSILSRLKWLFKVNANSLRRLLQGRSR